MVEVQELETAQSDLADGISNNRSKFEREAGEVSDAEVADASAAAAGTWEDGIQDAINDDLYTEGVRNPSRSYSDRIDSVAGRRYAEDTEGAAEAWGTQWEPFRQALVDLDLSDRAGRGSPQNYDRVEEVGQELHNLRTGGS